MVLGCRLKNDEGNREMRKDEGAEAKEMIKEKEGYREY